MTLRYTTYTIPGGIHPPERKTLSNRVQIRSAPMPSQLVIPLGQHLGAEATPAVAVGDKVYRGQVIGHAEGSVSAPVHASSSGTVIAIEPRPTQHPSGLRATCIIINTDGLDQWLEGLATPEEQKITTDDDAQDLSALFEKIHNAGIVGLGGAGFPTALKAQVGQLKQATQLEKSSQSKQKAPNAKSAPKSQMPGKHLNPGSIHTLILNAVECEPYITADDLTLRMRSREVLMGCDWLAKLCGAQTVSIGIEDNKPEAITALQTALKAYANEKVTPTRFEIVVVPTKYPSGGEKQLVQLITGQEVPQGGLPASLGVLCQNVGTAYAVYEALSLGRPLTARITTLTGEALPEKTRGNYEVRLGTPIAALLDALAVDWQKVDRLVMGGPMMGYTLDSANIPVVKVTNCVIAAPFSELPAPAPEMPCIRCGHCADACPASLLPQQLYWYSKSQDLEALSQYNVMDCIECGACSYVCPSHIPLVQYFRFGKGQIRQHAAETQKSDHARERFEARQARLEREQAERDAKRKARAKKAPATRQTTTERSTTAAPVTTSEHQTKNNSNAQFNAAETGPQGDAQHGARPDTQPSEQSRMPTANNADTLKTQYLKAEKRYKDLNRALTHLEKQAKASPSDEKTAQLISHKEKVAALKAQAEALKAEWLATRSGESPTPPQTPPDLTPTALKPNKPLNTGNKETH